MKNYAQCEAHVEILNHISENIQRIFKTLERNSTNCHETKRFAILKIVRFKALSVFYKNKIALNKFIFN